MPHLSCVACCLCLCSWSYVSCSYKRVPFYPNDNSNCNPPRYLLRPIQTPLTLVPNHRRSMHFGAVFRHNMPILRNPGIGFSEKSVQTIRSNVKRLSDEEASINASFGEVLQVLTSESLRGAIHGVNGAPESLTRLTEKWLDCRKVRVQGILVVVLSNT